MNRFLLIKCIALGALSFPSPFLLVFYLYDMVPAGYDQRFIVIIFLILSGSIVGILFYYKDAAFQAVKDWFPAEENGPQD